MKIVPDEIPEVIAPLSDTHAGVPESEPKPVVNPNDLKALNGKNVFVQLLNGQTLVGHLNTEGNSGWFKIGYRETPVRYVDVDSFKIP